MDKAHGQMLRGFKKALDKMGNVPLGHHILDPRTMESRTMTNMALMNNPVGMTSGLPQTARKVYQNATDIRKPQGPGQTEKNKLAGVVVDPSSHQTFTGTDQISIDTTGGYGITPTTFTDNG